MTTLTVQIVTPANWYRHSVGKRFEVKRITPHSNYFALNGSPHVRIHKDHCILTAIHYENDELPEHEAEAATVNGNG